jgi:hypothetical protein
MRDDKGRFVKGQSGNAKGRPQGTKTQRAVAERVGPKLDALVDKLLASALDGDTQAAKLLLDRIAPALKPADGPVSLPLTGRFDDDSKAVLTALGAGEISPSVAAQILAGINASARTAEVTEIGQRLQRLEEWMDGQSAAKT